MSAMPHPFACANCGTPLSGNFCHACGQRAHIHKSLMHLCEEVLHGVLHFDAKGLRTLPMLVLKPGELTRRYVDGHRTRFVSPLALFLFMVVTMFFVASLTGEKERDKSPQAIAQVKLAMDGNVARSKTRVEKAKAALLEAQKKGVDTADAKEELTDATEMLASMESSRKELDEPDDGKPHTGKFTSSTGWKVADDALKHAADNPELTKYKLKSAGSKYSFLLVPLSLPFLWLLFCRRRDVTMYDHAVFSLYSLSFMALLGSVLFVLARLGLDTLALFMFLGMPPVHMFLQLRGTYKLGRWAALWRAAALMLVAGVVSLLYLGIILLLSVR